MFDSSMSAATIAAKVNELQKAAGFSTPLLNPEGRGTSFITLTGELHAWHVQSEVSLNVLAACMTWCSLSVAHKKPIAELTAPSHIAQCRLRYAM